MNKTYSYYCDHSSHNNHCGRIILASITILLTLMVQAIAFPTQINIDGWKTLKNCKLIDNKSNDGDSFHVSHQNKEYVFRLYMVDCPETKYEYTERIIKQMEYFQSNHPQIIQIGEISKEFTKAFLKKPFTIVTKGEDALGSGTTKRIYGFVINSNNKDLGEILLQNGLARSFGKYPSGPKIDPSIKINYDLLQDKAKENQVGAWSRGKSLKLTSETLKYLNVKNKKLALANSNQTTTDRSAPIQSLLDSLSKEKRNRKNQNDKVPNSIFFKDTRTTRTTSSTKTNPRIITKKDLNLLLPKAKEVDAKANNRNQK